MSAATERERDELRDAEVKVQRQVCFQAIRDKVLAGDESAADEVGTALLDFAVDSREWLELIRTALSSSADVTGKRFTELVVQVIRDQAQADAVHQVEQMEADAFAQVEPVPRTRQQRIAAEWRAAGA